MKYRAYEWVRRCRTEIGQHRMTVFGTFTMSPEQDYLLDAEILSGTRKPDGTWKRPPVSFIGLTDEEVFELRVRAFGDRLTEFLWRLRKGRQGERLDLRYLLVAETHDGVKTSDEKRGRPHFHIMLHTNTPQVLVTGDPLEGSGEWLVSKKNERFVRDGAWLRKQWPYGYTTFKLATNGGAAWYVCKYITKSLTCRVRASQRYGLREVETKPARGNPEAGENGPQRASGS